MLISSMNTEDMVLNSLQLLSAAASPIHCFQSDASQRETLSIVYQQSPADSELLVKIQSYSLQYSEQNNTTKTTRQSGPALNF